MAAFTVLNMLSLMTFGNHHPLKKKNLLKAEFYFEKNKTSWSIEALFSLKMTSQMKLFEYLKDTTAAEW